VPTDTTLNVTETAPGALARLRLAAGVFSRFWPYTRGDRLRLLLAGTALITVSGCEVVAVLLFDEITTRVLQHRRLAGFWAPAGAWLAAACVAALAMFAAGYLTSLAGERFMLRLRDAVFAHAQRLSPGFFAERRLGDLMVRLTGDVEVVEQLACSGLVTTACSAVSAILFAGAAVALNWRLSLAVLAVAPLLALAARAFSGRVGAAAARERDASGSITSAVEQSLANQTLVQAFNRQNAESRRLHREGVSWLRARMAAARLSSAYGPLVYLIETAGVLAVLGVGSWQVAAGQTTLGGLLAFAVLAAYLYPPIQELSAVALDVSQASASAGRITEILHARPPVSDGTAVGAGLRSAGRVEFAGVTFAYPGAGQPVLDGLSFTAGPGRVLAVIGPSGSGKSTIARLLLRFYDPSAGRVLLDGIDIRELSTRTLRRNVTLLQQDSPLLAGTVMENIGYGASAATGAEIVAAAQAADAHGFIAALPEGYQTVVGEGGRPLSGGQRQRIAIARALIRDAPVLILDEPTTGLDEAGAQRAMALLRGLMAGRTTILITHDLRLVDGADQVLVLGETMPGRWSLPAASAVL
jgi:ATP-binding cassette, subfamily B, bacterial